MKPAILVWEFDDAPEMLRNLSGHGGDEDWLAAVPPGYDYVPWLEPGFGGFGYCDVSEHDHPTEPGWKVYIGAHA